MQRLGLTELRYTQPIAHFLSPTTHHQICCCCLITKLCPTLCKPMGCSLPYFSVYGISPRKNTGVDCHFLLQGIFQTQGQNPCLLLWHADFLPLSHQGSPHQHIKKGLFTAILHPRKSGYQKKKKKITKHTKKAENTI